MTQQPKRTRNEPLTLKKSRQRSPEPSKLQPVSPLALPQTKPQRKPVDLGEGIEWTDENLDDLSSVTSADIAASQALWEHEAPKELKNLLRANVEEGKK